MVKAFHREQFSFYGIMRLIQQRAGRWHLRVGEDDIPARFLLLKPTPDALPVGSPSRRRNVVDKVAQPLAQRKHAQALALARPVKQAVELRAQGLAGWGRDRHQFGGQLIDRMTETVAEACPREQRPQALDRTVEPISQDAAHPIGRLLPERRVLKHLIGRSKGRGTGVLRVAYMPEHTTTDNRRQIDLVGETAAVLLVSQEVGGQWQSTPSQHRHETVATKGTDQAIEGHRGDMMDHCTELQTEAPMGGQQRIAGHLGTHRAIAQDEMW
jgi:hypothetical protein